jgi:thiamine kinase-like enzyme
MRLDSGVARIVPQIHILPVTLAHGDFTPWNTFLMGERLYVFDWEYAQPAYPLAYDAVHFILAASPDQRPLDLLGRLEEELATRWYGGDRTVAVQAMLFSLLLHAVFYLGRAIRAGLAEQDWEEAERRARMIDALLVRTEAGR